MSNRHLFNTAVLLAATLAGCAAKPAIQPAGTMPAGIATTSTAPAEVSEDLTKLAATEAALERPLPLVQFNNIALADVFASVGKQAGVTIEPEWADLAKINVTPQTPVSTRLRNVKLTKVLKTVFESVSQTSEGEIVAETMPDAHLRVSTWSDFYARTGSTRRYPIGDLLGNASNVGSKEVLARSELKEQIASLIFDTIAVGRWQNAPDALPGRVGGTLTFDGDTMVVKQAAVTQRQVAGLLGKLREQRIAPVPTSQPTETTQPTR